MHLGDLRRLAPRPLRVLVACAVVATVCLVVPSGLVGAPPAAAASGDPFNPTVPQAWQVTGSPSTLNDVIIHSDGTISFVPEGPPAAISYNSLAFDSNDGYLYATATIGGVNKVIKIGQGGVVVDSNVATLPDSSPISAGVNSFIDGTIDPATNTMYVAGTNNSVVPFTAGWILAPVPRDPGPSSVEPAQRQRERLITLVTCSELFHTDNRMVAFGHLVGRTPAG